MFCIIPIVFANNIIDKFAIKLRIIETNISLRCIFTTSLQKYRDVCKTSSIFYHKEIFKKIRRNKIPSINSINPTFFAYPSKEHFLVVLPIFLSLFLKYLQVLARLLLKLLCEIQSLLPWLEFSLQIES